MPSWGASPAKSQSLFSGHEEAKKLIKRLLPTLRLPLTTTKLGVFFYEAPLNDLTHFFDQQIPVLSS
jgi:hypothetical protein